MVENAVECRIISLESVFSHPEPKNKPAHNRIVLAEWFSIPVMSLSSYCTGVQTLGSVTKCSDHKYFNKYIIYILAVLREKT